MGYDDSLQINTSINTDGIKNGMKNVESLVSKGMTAIAGATAVASTAVLGLGAYSTTVGKKFESSMSQVIATMGITKDTVVDGVNSYELLENAATKAGAETVFSASESAEALNYLALAGYSASKATQALPAILNLASAGGLNLAYASDLATDAMSALGIEATTENLTAFGDGLSKTASKANTSVAQLGEAILTVGGTAKNLSGGRTELNAILGVLANRGKKGSEAGTALRNIMLSLTAPTNKAKDSIENLGLEVYNAEGELRPLNEIFKDINSTMSDMSQGDKTEVLSEIFNKEDLGSVESLLAGCGEEYDQLAQAIDNSNGAMEQMAETMTDNLDGDLKSLQSRSEAFGISVYKHIQEPLRELATLGCGYIARFTEAFEEDGFKGLASEVGNILGEVITTGSEKLPEIGANIITSLADGLSEKAPELTKTGVKVITNFVDGIVDSIPHVIKAAKKVVKDFSKAISKEIPELEPFANIIEFIAEHFEEFGSIALGVWAALKGYTIITSITKAIGLLKVAVISLGTAAIANPIGLAFAGIAGITALVVGLTIATGEQKTAVEKSIETEQEYQDKISERQSVYDDLKTSAQENAESDLIEIERVQNLAKELDDLADSSGYVTEKDRERAEYILGELSEATGTEYEMIDGQIQKYGELKQSIEDVIRQKKAQIMLDANEDVYTEAIKNKTQVERDLAQANLDADSQEKLVLNKALELGYTIQDPHEAFDLVKGDYEDTYEEYQALFDSGKINIDFDSWINELDTLDDQVRLWDEKIVTTNLLNGELEDYYADIFDYEAAEAKIYAGEYVEAFDLLNNADTERSLKSASSSAERVRILQDEAILAEENYNTLAEKYRNGTYGVSQAMVDQAKSDMEQARDTLIAEQTKLDDERALAAKNGANKTFNTLIEEFQNSEGNLKNAGVNCGQAVTNGLSEGMTNNLGIITSKAFEVGNFVNSELQRALGIHSPSKVIADEVGRWILPGLSMGVEDSENETASNLSRSVDSIISSGITSQHEQLFSNMGSQFLQNYSENSPVNLATKTEKQTENIKENITENDMIINVSIGDEQIDSIVINAIDRVNAITGGVSV